MVETLTPPDLLAPVEQNTVDTQFWGIVAPLAEQFRFADALTDEMNSWQKVANATNDIVTPANAIDAVGFAASMYGLSRLDSWRGIVAAGAGLMTDVVDGKVARATGTQSALGEAIDAGGDKVKLAYALYKTWQLGLAPKPLLAAVAVQNGLNAGLTAFDQWSNQDQHVLHPSQFGKKAMFLQQLGIGLNVIGSEVAKANERRGRLIKLGGTAIGTIGVVVGGAATAGYASTLWHHRTHRH